MLKPNSQKLENIADEYVANGEFASRDDVVNDILKIAFGNDSLMERIIHDWKAVRFENSLIEGLESGKSTPLNFEEIRKLGLERIGSN